MSCSVASTIRRAAGTRTIARSAILSADNASQQRDGEGSEWEGELHDECETASVIRGEGGRSIGDGTCKFGLVRIWRTCLSALYATKLACQQREGQRHED